MAKRNRKGSISDVNRTLKNISKLNGVKFTIKVGMISNGLNDSEDPAFYGGLLEEGRVSDSRDYSFLKPALKNFHKEIDVKPLLKKLTKDKVGRRGDAEMIKASKEYARKAVDRVQEYILYEAPQYPDRERKNPTLLDTGKLFDSIGYKIYDKKKKVVGYGR